MTPKRSKSTVLILTIVFLLITSLGLCVLFAPSWSINAPKYPGSTDDFRDHADYEINSATIITSLDHGDINVFVPELVTPDVHTGLVSNILWHQSDYLKVVNALHQYVWHETLTDWKAYEILLSTSCEDSNKGFEAGRFTFFKPVWVKGSLYYAGHSMTILPQYNMVSWGGGTNFPRPIFGWKGYDLSRFKISAEDALRIAEENGGKNFRLSYNNRCGIQLYLGDTGWRLLYSQGLATFTIDINPYTGGFKIVSATK